MKKTRFQEKGQALIIIALAVVVLFGFAALGIDGSRVFSDKRNAQNAADTAVLAAALAKIRGNDYVAAANTRATSNGYSTDTDSTVVVHLCSEAGSTCTGLPAGAVPSEYIQVKITSTIPMTFAQVLGWKQITQSVQAVARVTGTTSSNTSSFFNGAGMVATRSDNSNQCFLANGGAVVRMHGTGIFINCTGSQAIFMNGGASLTMDSAGLVAGCYGSNGGAVFTTINCNQPQQVIDASTFASIPKTVAPPTCSSNAPAPQGNTYSGGIYPSGITLNSSAVFNPGIYCINGSFNVNGNATISVPSGTVQFVMGDNSINLSKSPNVFNDLEVYTRNGNLTLNANGNLNATRLRFFSTGTGNLDANSANATLTSSNAYFYFNSGYPSWNGNTQINLHAPPQGDTFGGLLIQMPWSNQNSVIINGGSSVVLTGTVLVPRSNVTFNGGSGFALHGQVIGYTYTTNGGSTQDIYYNASENYQPPAGAPSTIEFTQ